MAISDALTVMSANLWNLNAPLQERMLRFSDVVAEYRPDVIALQEVRPLPGSLARLQLELVPAIADYRVNYCVATSWEGGAEGLAIVTRVPPAEVRSYRLPDGPPDFEPTRAVQYARTRFGEGWLGVLNTHLAYHQASEPLRLQQVEFIGRLIADLSRARPDDALILCGDLNATPDSLPVRLLLELGGLSNPWATIAREKPSYAASNPFVGDDPGADVWLDYILTRGVTRRGLRLIDDWPEGPASDHHFPILEVSPQAR